MFIISLPLPKNSSPHSEMRGLATVFIAAPYPLLEPELFVPNKMVPNTAFPGDMWCTW